MLGGAQPAAHTHSVKGPRGIAAARAVTSRAPVSAPSVLFAQSVQSAVSFPLRFPLVPSPTPTSTSTAAGGANGGDAGADVAPAPVVVAGCKIRTVKFRLSRRRARSPPEICASNRPAAVALAGQLRSSIIRITAGATSARGRTARRGRGRVALLAFGRMPLVASQHSRCRDPNAASVRRRAGARPQRLH